MKTAISTLLSLLLLLFVALQVQSKDMADGMSKSDSMTPAPSMQHDDMGMKSDAKTMPHDDAKMQSDGNMKDEKMDMKHDTMQKEQPMIPSDAELRQKLTPLQYEVTRRAGTEPAFNNAYWNNHEPGIYVDIISGVPLFSSTDKYESGTGWPSFTRPIDKSAIVAIEDRSFFMTRTEIRAKLSDAHLGHVFTDGPAPTGLRYCMNSAALRFIPQADLAKEGYAEYEKLFK